MNSYTWLIVLWICGWPIAALTLLALLIRDARRRKYTWADVEINGTVHRVRIPISEINKDENV
jgi:hypothetical protein